MYNNKSERCKSAVRRRPDRNNVHLVDITFDRQPPIPSLHVGRQCHSVDLNPRPSPRSVDEYYEDLAEELGEILQQETTSEIPINVISQCQRLVETRQFVEQLLAKKYKQPHTKSSFELFRPMKHQQATSGKDRSPQANMNHQANVMSHQASLTHQTNMSHQYLTEIDVKDSMSSEANVMLGKPTRTSLLRKLQRRNSAPGLTLQRNLQRTSGSSAVKANQINLPAVLAVNNILRALIPEGESLHTFLSGARYNRARWIETWGQMESNSRDRCTSVNSSFKKSQSFYKTEYLPYTPPDTPVDVCNNPRMSFPSLSTRRASGGLQVSGCNLKSKKAWEEETAKLAMDKPSLPANICQWEKPQIIIEDFSSARETPTKGMYDSNKPGSERAISMKTYSFPQSVKDAPSAKAEGIEVIGVNSFVTKLAQLPPATDRPAASQPVPSNSLESIRLDPLLITGSKMATARDLTKIKTKVLGYSSESDTERKNFKDKSDEVVVKRDDAIEDESRFSESKSERATDQSNQIQSTEGAGDQSSGVRTDGSQIPSDQPMPQDPDDVNPMKNTQDKELDCSDKKTADVIFVVGKKFGSGGQSRVNRSTKVSKEMMNEGSGEEIREEDDQIKGGYEEGGETLATNMDLDSSETEGHNKLE